MVFLLFIYALVIISALKLRGQDDRPDVYRANTPLLYIGIVGNVVLLVYVIVDRPAGLLWVFGLLAARFRPLPGGSHEQEEARRLRRPARCR